MRHIKIGANTVQYMFLRDHPFFTASSMHYGMTVRSHDTSIEKTFLVLDVSPSPDSYQLFQITGATANQQENLAVGMVKLLPHGMSWYLDVHPASGDTLASVDHSITLYRGLIYSKQ